MNDFHLNPRVSELQESITIRLNTQAKELQSKGVKVLNLTAGELSFETPKNIQSFVRSRLFVNSYTPTLGLESLREQLAKHVQRVYGIPTSPKHIGVTAGAKQALFEVFQTILKPGDEVLIPTPYWVSYVHQVALAGGTPKFVTLTKTFDLDARAIKKSITSKTKAIILNSPHNPTGAVFSRKAVRSCVEAMKKTKAFMVVDDIYRTLIYDKSYASPVREIRDLDRLVLIDGFSKSHALTGWRIGYVAAHPDIIRSLGAFQSHASGNPSVISQYAALEAVRSGKESRQFAAVLRRRRRLVCHALRKISRISFVEPGGAFYVFVRIVEFERDSMKFCERLLNDAHVALVPGEAFGSPGFVRLSFAADETTLKES